MLTTDNPWFGAQIGGQSLEIFVLYMSSSANRVRDVVCHGCRIEISQCGEDEELPKVSVLRGF